MEVQTFYDRLPLRSTPLDAEKELDPLMSKIQSKVDQAKDLVSSSAGTPCLAKYSEDGQWWVREENKPNPGTGGRA